MVTDSRYVHDGVSAMRRGAGRSYLEGTDGDLWTRLLHIPVRTRWIPSHLSREAAAAAGVADVDWMGNFCADLGAKHAATGRGPADAIVEARKVELEAL